MLRSALLHLLLLTCLSLAHAQAPAPPQATSLLGEPLYSPPPSEALLVRFQEKEAAYLADPNNVDNLIWYGRFLAYKGDYLGAIDLYTQGIRQFPRDARLYRHRAHRYITTRRYDRAVRDMRRAVRLIKKQPNEIEPDGMPNAQNIPVSTLHGNIYYHLGLAYYLQGNLLKAAEAFQTCINIATNDDERVSATHWAYMILRRMGDEAEAAAVLRPITAEMNIIENTAYHRLCLFYQGKLSAEELTGGAEGESSSNDAVLYGLGNWYLYGGNQEKAMGVFRQILEKKGWASFGYIAAEADVARLR